MAVNINIPKPTYTKNDIGLGNVDNTSDLNKPISTATQTALDGKVDKVTGKGLSENDFTNTLKTKLDGIQDGAEVNVNADWNATSGDAQILNKPTIPSVTGLVPYTGATTDVDLDTFGLDAKFIKIKGTGGNGHLNLKHQSSASTAGGSESVLYADNSGNPKWKNDGNAVQNVMLENSAITGATKTKITYDSKGLVTAGADATTADIADSTDKRYVTDAQLTILGNTSNTNTGDQTFLNPRVQAVTSSATVTPTSTDDLVKITAQAVDLTLANPTGTFVEGQSLIIRIKDNGTARLISFGSNYRAVGVVLPTTTTISKTTYIGGIWNDADSKLDIVGICTEA